MSSVQCSVFSVGVRRVNAVLFGFLCHVGVFALAYLFLPPESPLSPDKAHHAPADADPSHTYFPPEYVTVTVTFVLVLVLVLVAYVAHVETALPVD